MRLALGIVLVLAMVSVSLAGEKEDLQQKLEIIGLKYTNAQLQMQLIQQQLPKLEEEYKATQEKLKAIEAREAKPAAPTPPKPAEKK